MPDAQGRIEEGVRHERNGALYLALDEFQAAARSAEGPELLAQAYRHMADVHRTLSNWGDALDTARLSAEVSLEAGLDELYAEALNAEALVHHSRGDFLAATPLYEQILERARDDRLRGIAQQNLGSIAALRGDFAAAEGYFDESYRSFDRAAYLRGVAISLNNYARLALDRKDLERAESVCARALVAARTVEDQELIGLATLNQAELLGMEGQLDRAEELANAALGYFSVMDNPWRRIECLRLLGDLRLRHGFQDAAVHCYSQALDLAQSLGVLFEASQLLGRLEQAKAGIAGD